MLTLTQKIERLCKKLYPFVSTCMIHRREMIRKRWEKGQRLHRELEGLPKEAQDELIEKYEEQAIDGE